MPIFVANAKVEGGNRGRMQEAREAMVAASRAEAGRLSYTYAWDFAEPDTLRAVELWRDAEALRFHFATPHMAAFLKTLKEMGNPPPEITVYEAGNPHPIAGYGRRPG